MLQVQAFQADRCFHYEMDAEELAEWLQWDDAACFDRILVDGVDLTRQLPTIGGWVLRARSGWYPSVEHFNTFTILSLMPPSGSFLQSIYVTDPAQVVVDPVGPSQGSTWVIRGASWLTGRTPELRLAWRDVGAAGKFDLGFRLARYAE